MNMLERTTSRVNVKKPKIRWQTPDFLEEYLELVKQIFYWIGCLFGLLGGAAIPPAILIGILWYGSGHHIGWILPVFVTLLLSIFWYAGYAIIIKKFQDLPRSRKPRGW